MLSKPGQYIDHEKEKIEMAQGSPNCPNDERLSAQG